MSKKSPVIEPEISKTSISKTDKGDKLTPRESRRERRRRSRRSSDKTPTDDVPKTPEHETPSKTDKITSLTDHLDILIVEKGSYYFY